MQRLAGELGLSETVFVLEELRRLRIFTPTAELPLAGHPVVGAAFELGRLGLLDDGEHVFRTGVGDTPVALRNGVATMTQPDLRVRRELDHGECATLLGIQRWDVVGQPVLAETAVPFALAQVAAGDVLAGLDPDIDAIATLADVVGLAAWCESEGDLSVRVFAPQLGIREDPATGAAAGALGAVRVHQGAAPGSVTVRQGGHLGRPSTIQVDVGGEPGRPEGVRVGGTASPVLRATIDVETLRRG
jgi:trans-2,3-dihydro-3-hydroxyanthranilate isomerase